MGKSYQITEAELKALEELRTQNKDKDTERRLHAVILRGELVTLREIKAAYEEKTGQALGTYSQIYKLLHRHKWRKIKPRPKHEKKASPEAIEASKKLTQL